MNERSTSTAPSPRSACLQLVVLAALTAVLYHHELGTIWRFAVVDSEASHALAAVPLVMLLAWHRRAVLGRVLRRGSMWGVVLLILGLLIKVLAGWFNYGLPRQQSIVVVLAGGVLAVGGWALLRRCVPMLLLLLIAVPLGPRIHASLTRQPEQVTIRATMATVEMMPDVAAAELHGPDLHYITASGRGTVALGEPHRWMALLQANLMLCVFVAFSRVRPPGHLLILALACGPILLLCNFARILTWCLLSIYGGAEPTGGTPRVIGALVSMILCYVLSALLAAGLWKLAPPRRAEAERTAGKETS
jgi:hypothetical protein